MNWNEKEINIPHNAEDICRKASRIAVLEDVMNQTNVGAIIRSAAALDIDAVPLTPGCSDPLTDVLSVSAWERFSSFRELILKITPDYVLQLKKWASLSLLQALWLSGSSVRKSLYSYLYRLL